MDKDIENVKFGEHLAKLRIKRGISQEALALQSGINRTYMGEVERGEKSPSLVVISKIAKGLGISKKDLMDYEQRIIRNCVDFEKKH